MPRPTLAIHLIDYSKGYHPTMAFIEWLRWIEAMAPYDDQTN